MRRYRTHAAIAVAALITAASGTAMAEDAPAAKSKFDEMLDSAGLTVSGYVAASYSASNGYPFNIHQFDVSHNTFQLDQAGFQVAYQPKEGFGALVDLIAGEDAKILHQAEANNFSDTSSFDVRQAFLQYATGNLTVMAGKFVTLAGAEVINPTLNTNFSRSLLFFDSEPLTHTGVRAAYAATGEITLYAGINNGWNSTSTNYGSKTGEFGIAYAPSSKLFALALNAYFGKNEALDAEKTLIDIVGTYNVTSQLSLVLNFDYDKQDQAFLDGSDASWHAAALYANYAVNDQWRVSVRAEYLDDQDGFVTGAPQTLKEGTVTVGYAPFKNFELRAEFRYDKSGSDTPIFYKTREAISAATPDSNSLSEFALQAVYKFSAPPPAP